MTLSDLEAPTRFRTSHEVLADLEDACAANPDLATFEVVGVSEEGRAIAGVTMGLGPQLVTLVAGAHADEPVGPETLRAFVLECLAARGWGAEGGGLEDVFERFTFRVIPHLNPDGEARNRSWIETWDASRPAESLGHYLRGRRREPPGRDLEFGYPDLRVENEAATAFLFDGTPVALHASLHGMGFSEGALLLIEKEWLVSDASSGLQDGFTEAARRAGLPLHDHDRGGDKGFVYGGPGFWSTPRGAAMREHFLEVGDPETASKFRSSSMEQAATTFGGKTLSVVTELPLFRLAPSSRPGVTESLQAFKAEMPSVLEDAAEERSLQPWVDRFEITCPPLEDQVRLHLRVLDHALEAVGDREKS